MTPQPTLLTTDEVAQLLRLTPGTVRDWVTDNKIPAIRLPGGQLRFRREDLDALLSVPADSTPAVIP